MSAVSLSSGTRGVLLWVGLAIGAAGFAWGAATNPSALMPLWAGASWIWLAVLAGAAAGAALAQWLVRRPRWLVLATGSALAAAAFGLQAFTAVALILVSAFALGSRLLEWVHDGAAGLEPPDVPRATAVGFAACALVLGITAHWPINTRTGYLALCALALTLGWRGIRDAWIAFVESPEREGEATPPWLLAALWFAFGLHLAFAALPERYYDALAMHLVVARAVELFGRWHFDASQYAWAVQPMGANWLLTWAFVLAGEYAAKLLSAMMLILACALVVESSLLPRRLALLAVAMLLLMPLAFIETASLFVDNALTLFVVAAIVFASELRDHPSPERVTALWFVACAAISVKLHGAIAAACTGMALLALGGWREAFRADLRTRALCIAAVVAGFAPYAYAWRATGNPLLPHFNGIFKSPFVPPTDFNIDDVYDRGISLGDFFELTFSSHRYLEGGDGAAAFAVPLLLPAGLLLLAAAGPRRLRFAALTALAYAAIVLFNIRYLRYLFPVLPFLMLVLVYPLCTAKGRVARTVILVAAIAGTAWGVMRVPAAGWILKKLDLPAAFSAEAKEKLIVEQAPLRRLGRIEAALGGDDSKVVVFGEPVGADVRGRPLYINWYHPRLEAKVVDATTPAAAANILAGLGATHVIFDNRKAAEAWKPWRVAAAEYGRLVERNDDGELYEFHAAAAPGVSLFPADASPWQGWNLPRDDALKGKELTLAPGAATSRAADVGSLPEGSLVTLAASPTCEGTGSLRTQINWLRADGAILRVDSAASRCGTSTEKAGLSAAKPKGAAAVYFYFTNDGGIDARVASPRAAAFPKP